MSAALPGYGPIPYMERALSGEPPSPEALAHALKVWDASARALWALQLPYEERPGKPLSGSRRHNCARYVAARLAGLEEAHDAGPRRQGNYLKGRIVEAVARCQAILGGLPSVLSPSPDDGEEVSYTYRLGGDEYTDRPDLVWREGGALVVADFKGGNQWAVNELRDGEPPPTKFDQAGQVFRHMRAVEDHYAEPVARGYYVVIDAATFQYAQAVQPWSVEAWDDMERTYIAGSSSVSSPFSIPRPSWATTKFVAGCEEITSPACSYCGYRARCWPGFDLVVLSKGPVWRKPNTEK